MTIERIKNDPLLGGSSYVLSSPDDIGKLPPEYRSLVGESELEVLTNHTSYFTYLRDNCDFLPMRNWLDLVIDSNRVSVTTYIDGLGQRAALINTLGGCVRLQKFFVDESCSPQLKTIFGLIGSIHEWGFGAPNVLELGQFGTVEEFDNRMLNYKSGPPAGAFATEFYSADCGDSLLAVGDQVFHRHLGGAVHGGGSLDTVLTQYFRRLSGLSSEFKPEVDYTQVEENAT